MHRHAIRRESLRRLFHCIIGRVAGGSLRRSRMRQTARAQRTCDSPWHCKQRLAPRWTKGSRFFSRRELRPPLYCATGMLPVPSSTKSHRAIHLPRRCSKSSELYIFDNKRQLISCTRAKAGHRSMVVTIIRPLLCLQAGRCLRSTCRHCRLGDGPAG